VIRNLHTDPQGDGACKHSIMMRIAAEKRHRAAVSLPCSCFSLPCARSHLALAFNTLHSVQLRPAMHEFILGGQKSGKSRAAEMRAARWLQTPGQNALLIATALAGDPEIADRIARHRTERARRVPGLATLEEAYALSAALRRESTPQRLLVVDCLTLWWTQLAMPLNGPGATPSQLEEICGDLVQTLRDASGPVLLVSNEIGLGLAPLSAEARRCVDALGRLHQQVAGVCSRVTLMVAGCELAVKGGPA
jgi:adenosylcobinamide kinase / adenosylcobinamide-phosphate guanylyltransferase